MNYFDIRLTDSAGRVIEIDTPSGYGYWTRSDGSIGGTMRFDDERALVDYSNVYFLPQRVCRALRAAGFIIDDAATRRTK